MKKILHSGFRYFLCSVVIMMLGFGAKASHLVGLDLHYTWISGNDYRITLVAYGDCGPSSASAFSTLPYSSPQICIYDGATHITSINLIIDTPATPDAGKEITPVCPADSDATQCHSTTSSIPGIKQFVYTGVYTIPHLSTHWRFVFYGYMGAGSATGRAAALTNITGGTITQLVDTLNNSVHNNSNPVLTIVPVPFFCLNNPDSYNPGAVDPDGDSLYFNLVPGANGSGSSTCATSGYVTYLSGYTAADPLHAYTGTFSFDHSTGQVLFTPDITQRSLVVYNIEEYRDDTLIGTSQREMSFLVLTCTNTPPTGGFTGSSGGGTLDDSTHFHICGNTSAFTINLAPTETDTSNVLYMTTTGVPSGCSFVVYNDSTNHPTATINWTSVGVTPGIYTFYVVVSDNNCPLKGTTTLALTMEILPIPSISYTVISPNSCIGQAIVSVTPGGLGSPWHVKLVNSGGTTLQDTVGVTGTFLDTLGVGTDVFTIYSNLSTLCSSSVPITIAADTLPDPTITYKSPSYCGANDGSIHISGMHPSELDTVNYTINGVAVPELSVLTSDSGTIDITGLYACVYDHFVLSYWTCHTTQEGPFTLVNPAFTANYDTKQDPSQCGLNDGFVELTGLIPGQLDTVNYTLGGVAQPPYISVALPDSTIIIPNLYSGVYSYFVVSTSTPCTAASTCVTTPPIGPVVLTAPSISVGFDTMIHLGCKGDSVFFTNSSTPSTGLNYRWYFGDGATDTTKNPLHVYHPVATTSYTSELIITNGHCEDSMLLNIPLPESVHSSFTVAPDTICQGDTISFTNSSIGVSNSYTWYFGDGNTSNGLNPTNTYLNTGAYVVTLVAKDHISCLDTSAQMVQVDSNTVLSLHLSDSVICDGGLVTFTGDFTNIGLTKTQWTFGDGSSFTNANPIQHAFDVTGNLTVNLTVSYRQCPTATISKGIRIYPNPNIYLGSDTSICPGSTALTLSDNINMMNPLASWLWNTGDLTPAIIVKKPGTYIATVTIYGCIATDTVYVVNDCYADFPNVFSPNGDGVNDYFFPRQYLTKGLTEFSMNIYNRWGQLVYQTTDLEGRGWDGNFNNTAQPEGVYVYIITAKFKDGQMLNKQGNITLLR